MTGFAAAELTTVNGARTARPRARALPTGDVRRTVRARRGRCAALILRGGDEARRRLRRRRRDRAGHHVVASAGAVAGVLAALAMIVFMAAAAALDGDALGAAPRGRQRPSGGRRRSREARARSPGGCCPAPASSAWRSGSRSRRCVPKDFTLPPVGGRSAAGCALLVMAFAVPLARPGGRADARRASCRATAARGSSRTPSSARSSALAPVAPAQARRPAAARAGARRRSGRGPRADGAARTGDRQTRIASIFASSGSGATS